jgi:hypothetical protein
VNIAAHQADDVIVVIIAASHASEAPSFSVSAGWTVVTGPSTATSVLLILRRTATSSVHTLDITSSPSVEENKFAIHSYAIRFAFGSVSTDYATASRNPPSLTPSWGSETNLWIAANLTTGTVPATPPTAFGNGVQTQNTVKLSTADLSVDAPTLDPGAFEGSAGATDISMTIAVRPA